MDSRRPCGSKLRHHSCASAARGDSIWLTSASLLSPSQRYLVSALVI